MTAGRRNKDLGRIYAGNAVSWFAHCIDCTWQLQVSGGVSKAKATRAARVHLQADGKGMHEVKLFAQTWQMVYGPEVTRI